MEVIGHRGAAAIAPENTWESFDAAISVGADAIETDVRASSDGKLVLIHDDRLDRTTSGQGLVTETPWKVIKSLDAGGWFDQKFRSARVPSLQKTLEYYGHLTHLVLEIKQPGIELQALEMVANLDLMDHVTFTSFELQIIQRIKRTSPKSRVGYLSRDEVWKSARIALDSNVDQFCPPASMVSYSSVSQWKDAGLEVRVWKVKDTEAMLRAVQAGVDGMTVDFPRLLLRVLGRVD